MITPAPTPATAGAGSKGFFDGFGWAQGAVIIAAILAAIIAVLGYTIQRKIARRTERATLYGNAIGAVEAYLEGPYRIRRKTKDPNNWFALSSALSDTKTSISHHQALLEMHGPKDVAAAFKTFTDTATGEAGPHMTAAWGATIATEPTNVPLGVGYSRTSADTARTELVRRMAADLKAINTWWRVTR